MMFFLIYAVGAVKDIISVLTIEPALCFLGKLCVITVRYFSYSLLDSSGFLWLRVPVLTFMRKTRLQLSFSFLVISLSAIGMKET